MKNRTINLVCLTLGFVVATTAMTAQADYVIGRERPILTGQAQILAAKGTLSNTHAADVTLTRQDGSKNYTGVVLKIEGQVSTVSVNSVITDSCGSQHISGNAEGIAITLIDHSRRICEDFRQYVWEVKVIQSISRNQKLSTGALSLGVVRPEGVITIQ